jgi:hypothetical protein
MHDFFFLLCECFNVDVCNKDKFFSVTILFLFCTMDLIHSSSQYPNILFQYTILFSQGLRVRNIAENDYYLRHVSPSVCPAICPHGTTRLSMNE